MARLYPSNLAKKPRPCRWGARGRGLLRGLPLALPLVLVVALAGCQERLAVRGHFLEDEDIAALDGESLNRDAVRRFLGEPSSRRLLREAGEGETWLYIGERTSQKTYHDTQVLARRILVLHFDETGFVSTHEVLTQDDGQVVVPRAQRTPTPGRQFTLWQQFVGNFGRFNTPTATR